MQPCKIIATLLCLLFSGTTYSQPDFLDCKGLREGVFYNYPKHSDSKLVFERFGNYQKETDQKTGDTTLWEIKWKSDCVYSIEYINGNNTANREAAALLKKKKLKIIFRVDTITDHYYTYFTYFNKTSNSPLGLDTMWFHEKYTLSNSKLIELVTIEKDLSKPFFNDTSYALIYIYRPGKLTNSLVGFPLYLDNNIIGFMKNRSGYIYKILKEGIYELGSKAMDDSSFVAVEVKYGQKYYVKSIIQWGVHATRNFNLEMKLMPNEIGEKEFEEVKWNK